MEGENVTLPLNEILELIGSEDPEERKEGVSEAKTLSAHPRKAKDFLLLANLARGNWELDSEISLVKAIAGMEANAVTGIEVLAAMKGLDHRLDAQVDKAIKKITPIVWDGLVADLEHHLKDKRQIAAVRLGNLNLSPSKVKQIAGIAQHPTRFGVRRDALQAFLDMGQVAIHAIEPLMELVGARRWDIRMTALRAVGQLNRKNLTRDNIEAIGRSLNSALWQERTLGALVLSKLAVEGSKKAVLIGGWIVDCWDNAVSPAEKLAYTYSLVTLGVAADDKKTDAAITDWFELHFDKFDRLVECVLLDNEAGSRVFYRAAII